MRLMSKQSTNHWLQKTSRTNILLLLCLLTAVTLLCNVAALPKYKPGFAKQLDITPNVNCDESSTTNMMYHQPHFIGNRSVIVQLFEWKFLDIAEECRLFLGPQGYAGVQLSPVFEHTLIKSSNLNHPWWERYEVISYRLASRSGDESEFWSMSRICNDNGVRIYADVILNHMAAPPHLLDSSVTNRDFIVDTLLEENVNISHYNYPNVSYTQQDFHRPCSIGNTQDAHEIRNCQLNGHPDLDHTQTVVQQNIVEMLNKFIEMGVAGFRIDTAKYIWPIDLKQIYAQVENLNEEFDFPKNTRPFFYQDVFDLGLDSISKTEYTTYGIVSEYLYPAELAAILNGRAPLSSLINWGPAMGFLAHQDSLVFIDSPDTQRGLPLELGLNHMLTYKQHIKYIMANAFMLAHSYGNIKRIMSSYYYADMDINQGPPMEEQDENIIRSPQFNGNHECTIDSGWVCEHRWLPLVNMVKVANYFRGQKEESIIHFQTNGPNQIAFCRGYKLFMAMNNDAEMDFTKTVYTCLEPGIYCDMITGGKKEQEQACHGRQLEVNELGYAELMLPVSDDNNVDGNVTEGEEEEEEPQKVESYGVLVVYVESKLRAEEENLEDKDATGSETNEGNEIKNDGAEKHEENNPNEEEGNEIESSKNPEEQDNANPAEPDANPDQPEAENETPAESANTAEPEVIEEALEENQVKEPEANETDDQLKGNDDKNKKEDNSEPTQTDIEDGDDIPDQSEVNNEVVNETPAESANAGQPEVPEEAVEENQVTEPEANETEDQLEGNDDENQNEDNSEPTQTDLEDGDDIPEQSEAENEKPAESDVAGQPEDTGEAAEEEAAEEPVENETEDQVEGNEDEKVENQNEDNADPEETGDENEINNEIPTESDDEDQPKVSERSAEEIELAEPVENETGEQLEGNDDGKDENQDPNNADNEVNNETPPEGENEGQPEVIEDTEEGNELSDPAESGTEDLSEPKANETEDQLEGNNDEKDPDQSENEVNKEALPESDAEDQPEVIEAKAEEDQVSEPVAKETEDQLEGNDDGKNEDQNENNADTNQSQAENEVDNETPEESDNEGQPEVIEGTEEDNELPANETEDDLEGISPESDAEGQPEVIEGEAQENELPESVANETEDELEGIGDSEDRKNEVDAETPTDSVAEVIEGAAEENESPEPTENETEDQLEGSGIIPIEGGGDEVIAKTPTEVDAEDQPKVIEEAAEETASPEIADLLKENDENAVNTPEEENIAEIPAEKSLINELEEKTTQNEKNPEEIENPQKILEESPKEMESIAVNIDPKQNQPESLDESKQKPDEILKNPHSNIIDVVTKKPDSAQDIQKAGFFSKSQKDGHSNG